MEKYIVEWSHEFLARSPYEAAEEAFHIMAVGYSEPLSVDVKDMAGNVVRIYSTHPLGGEIAEIHSEED